MHLTTTNPVPGVWRQNTRAGVILAISFTRLSRRNARISAHTMRMRAYARIPARAMRMRAYARISAHTMRMRAYARIPAHAMRMRAFLRMRCARTCAHFSACDAMRCDANARMRCDANARIKGELMRVRYCICSNAHICGGRWVTVRVTHVVITKRLDMFETLTFCYWHRYEQPLSVTTTLP